MWASISILILVCHLQSSLSEDEHDPEFLTPKTYVANLAKQYGYPMESHKTVTEDGYHLTLYLMPQAGEKRFRSRTVFFNHGYIASSDCWFVNHQSAILPLRLYDQGYNIMLGNFRGTTHSQGHDKLDMDTSQFWDFSFDELGRYDVASMIDYTLKVLKQDKLFLIGHSMGTTSAFVLLSERPEYNEKLYGFIALAPSVFEFRSTSRIKKWLAPFLNIPRISKMSKKILDNIIPTGRVPAFYERCEKWRKNCGAAIIGKFVQNSSASDRLEAQSCARIVNEIGLDEKKMGKKSWETLFSVPIETSSIKCGLHYVQSMNGNYFRKFDYGRVENFKIYNSRLPSDYDLSKITCPVSLVWGDFDEFSSKSDMKTLVGKLTRTRDLQVFQINQTHWNHFDFVGSKAAAILMNPFILRSIETTK